MFRSSDLIGGSPFAMIAVVKDCWALEMDVMLWLEL